MENYKIIRELGRSTTGLAYEAEDNRSHAKVMLKLMPIPAGVDSGYVDQQIGHFKNEASVLSQLKHPGIAQPFDSGLFEGKLYAARELCQGTTLGEFLKHEKTLEHPKAQDIALKLLSALVAAHKQGIFHGDIRPENIMLARDGSVKLMDFGIAKLEAGLRVSNATPYMAPEHISRNTFDQKNDIFSVGAVLYEALSGERVTAPVDLQTKMEPRMLNTLPAAWSGILRKALTGDPGKRYQSAAQMMDDVLVERNPVVVATIPAVQPTIPKSPSVQQYQNTPPQTPQDPGFASRNDPDDMPFWSILFMDAGWFGRRSFGFRHSFIGGLLGLVIFIVVVVFHPHGPNQDYARFGNDNRFPLLANYILHRLVTPVIIAVLVIAVVFIVRRFTRRP